MSTKLLRHHSKSRAQAMVEFAIVLPILIVVVIGIFEAARMIFIYSAVTTASREAARFGSVVGYDDDGQIKYKHCGLISDPYKGIRGMARRSAYFLNLLDANITIQYDHGPGTTVFHTCTGNVDPGYFVNSGDRILVTVTGQYNPLTRLMPWGPRAFQSESARTILGYQEVAPNTAVPSAPPNTPVGGGPTDTPTSTATGTSTATFTSTPGGDVDTLTPVPSATITLLPADTSTPGDTPTATDTPTMTPTPTLTPTPTMVTDCDQVSAGAISISGDTMSMTINNPNPYPLTVQDIYVVWNAAAGADNGTLLILKSVTLVDLFQTVNDDTGTKLITPASTVIMPASAPSTVMFTFDQPYVVRNNNESIVINLSTLGCEGHPIHSP